MRKRIFSVMLLAAMFTAAAFAGNPLGVAETVFNRRFIPTLKPQLSYEQIAKMSGVPGEKLAESKEGASKVVNYRWKGGRDSVLTPTSATGAKKRQNLEKNGCK
jgi:hypothetical protein